MLYNKTIKEWAKNLPLEVEPKFLANIEKGWENYVCDTLSEAIPLAFKLYETPEGFDYWNAIVIQAGNTLLYSPNQRITMPVILVKQIIKNKLP